MPINSYNKNLLVIPSIDIKDKKLVRVVQGIPEVAEYDYSDDPIKMAKLWRAENAKCLHIIDFDGAWQTGVNNYDIIAKLVKSVVLPIQFGGGLRTYEKIKKVFEMGITRVILGTIAVTDNYLLKKILEEFGIDKILISLDILHNKVMIEGRKTETEFDPISLIIKLQNLGINRFIITDIERNGMMTGPNFELLENIAKNTSIKITASGGVNNVSDLFKLQEMKPIGIDSVIVGRALYENHFPCQKLWRIAEKGTIGKKYNG